jgi:uncharacterized protein YkwD
MRNRTMLRLCLTVTLATLLMAMAAVRVAGAESLSPSPDVALQPMEANLLDQLNGERAQRGIQTLDVDPQLEELARQRSQDMADRGYFSHVTPEGAMVFDMMNARGIPYLLAGENLAFNNAAPWDSPSVAHQGFMNSPTHLANELEGSFNRIGVGVAQAPDGVFYFAEVFAQQ